MAEISGQRIETTITVPEEDQRKGTTLESVALAGVARCRFICEPHKQERVCPVVATTDTTTNTVTLSCEGLPDDNGCTSDIVGDWGKTQSPVTVAAEWMVERANDLSVHVEA